jgi:drug/metabolite transporter (DMT)-like permease
MALFPVLLAYGMWERAMRRGTVTLVAAVSNLAPLLSTFISSAYLGVAPGWNLWAACALVIAGAALCNRMVVPER